MNLDNNRIVAVINSRETEDVQAVLDTFPNLKYLSRDRGKQYQNLSTKYIHIADRFHIIKNISDNLIKAIQKIIPNKLIIVDEQEKSSAIKSNIKIIEEYSNNKKRTIAHKNKIELIQKVRNEYTK